MVSRGHFYLCVCLLRCFFVSGSGTVPYYLSFLPQDHGRSSFVSPKDSTLCLQLPYSFLFSIFVLIYFMLHVEICTGSSHIRPSEKKLNLFSYDDQNGGYHHFEYTV